MSCVNQKQVLELKLQDLLHRVDVQATSTRGQHAVIKRPDANHHSLPLRVSRFSIALVPLAIHCFLKGDLRLPHAGQQLLIWQLPDARTVPLRRLAQQWAFFRDSTLSPGAVIKLFKGWERRTELFASDMLMDVPLVETD